MLQCDAALWKTKSGARLRFTEKVAANRSTKGGLIENKVGTLHFCFGFGENTALNCSKQGVDI